MSKFILLLLIISFLSPSFSQNGFSKTSHDFGEVYKGNERFVDVIYTNNTGKKTFLLTIKNERTVRVLTSGKAIMPDSSIILRFKYNPIKKGKFTIKTPIYFSHAMTPFEFTMKGNIKEIDNSMGMDCPSFRQKDITIEQEFKFKALVLDAKTNEPIKKAEIKLIINGMLLTTLMTNNKGKATAKIPLGLYYLVTNAKDYYPNERAKYLNKRNDSVIIYLNKDESIIVTEKPDEIIEIKTDSSIIVSIPPDTINTPTETKDTAVTEDTLVEYYQAPNNIVFLLDVSSSMNHNGKLDLLKNSMIEMTHTLRSVDKITIVAYSTFSKILMETTTGNAKKEIIEKIQSIKAQGMTAGGEGMKLAYKQAYKNFIPNANNQVIMATDGDFNRGNTSVDKLVKKYIKKDIKISVLGIKNKAMHATDMQEIAELGKGHYLFIDNYATSKKILIDELKVQSLRRKY